MAARLGILIIHGVGRQKAGYSAGFQADLAHRLDRRGVPAADVAMREIFWQDIVQTKEDAYREAASRTRLDAKLLRDFLLGFLADATVYTFPRHEAGAHNVYDAIHRRIADAVRDVEGAVVAGAPIVGLAHSLGGHILSNYIYDRQKRWVDGDRDDRLATTDFQRLKTLAALVTFGCNIPLFVMSTDPFRPIRVPAPSGQLPAAWSDAGKWLNLYDPDDVLGWPLLPLADEDPETRARLMTPADAEAFHRMVVDRPIDAGWWGIQNWNVLSHIAYWEDGDVLGPIAELVADLRGALP